LMMGNLGSATPANQRGDDDWGKIGTTDNGA
jgi:hypothetical protein